MISIGSSLATKEWLRKNGSERTAPKERGGVRHPAARGDITLLRGIYPLYHIITPSVVPEWSVLPPALSRFRLRRLFSLRDGVLAAVFQPLHVLVEPVRAELVRGVRDVQHLRDRRLVRHHRVPDARRAVAAAPPSTRSAAGPRAGTPPSPEAPRPAAPPPSAPTPRGEPPARASATRGAAASESPPGSRRRTSSTCGGRRRRPPAAARVPSRARARPPTRGTRGSRQRSARSPRRGSCARRPPGVLPRPPNARSSSPSAARVVSRAGRRTDAIWLTTPSTGVAKGNAPTTRRRSSRRTRTSARPRGRRSPRARGPSRAPLARAGRQRRAPAPASARHGGDGGRRLSALATRRDSSGRPAHVGHRSERGKKSVAAWPHPCATNRRPTGSGGVCHASSTRSGSPGDPERIVHDRVRGFGDALGAQRADARGVRRGRGPRRAALVDLRHDDEHRREAADRRREGEEARVRAAAMRRPPPAPPGATGGMRGGGVGRGHRRALGRVGRARVGGRHRATREAGGARARMSETTARGGGVRRARRGGRTTRRFERSRMGGVLKLQDPDDGTKWSEHQFAPVCTGTRLDRPGVRQFSEPP